MTYFGGQPLESGLKIYGPAISYYLCMLVFGWFLKGKENRKKDRRMLVVLVVVAVGLPATIVAKNIPLLLERYPEQDQCEFGTGSTAFYDGLRKSADRFLKKEPMAQLDGYSSIYTKRFSKRIESQVKKFAMSHPTPTERWAALHALMRAYGFAFHDNSQQDTRNFTNGRIELSATYFAVLPKLNWFCWVCLAYPEAFITHRITERESGTYNQVKTGLAKNWLHFKAPLKRKRSKKTCPVVLK